MSYTVNANGNLTARGTDTFAYDQANRLISATVGGATSTYAYDGDGKRVSSTVGGTTTRSVYDVNAGLPVLLDDGTRKYVFGLGLAYAVDTAGTVEIYHTDGLGSVRAITDAAGTVIQTYQTDEFGIPTQTQGSSTQPFGYTGEPRDGETGFVYLRARMYDPQTGRFVQRDPYPGKIGSPLSLHRYAYVQNNPINATNPSGLDPLSKITQYLATYQNDCVIEAPGPIEGVYLVNAECMDLLVQRIVQVVVPTPLGPSVVTGIHLLAPSGLNNASPGLTELYSEGSVRGRALITIREILLRHGFTQNLTRNRQGYLFTNALGEEVRLMRSGGGWDIRVRNRYGNYLDEFGNTAPPGETHGIQVVPR